MGANDSDNAHLSLHSNYLLAGCSFPLHFINNYDVLAVFALSYARYSGSLLLSLFPNADGSHRSLNCGMSLGTHGISSSMYIDLPFRTDRCEIYRGAKDKSQWLLKLFFKRWRPMAPLCVYRGVIRLAGDEFLSLHLILLTPHPQMLATNWNRIFIVNMCFVLYPCCQAATALKALMAARELRSRREARNVLPTRRKCRPKKAVYPCSSLLWAVS